ncbi:MAG: peptidoglycan DD-metalloendopeptidase family protein [Clostridia bacterium]
MDNNYTPEYQDNIDENEQLHKRKPGFEACVMAGFFGVLIGIGVVALCVSQARAAAAPQAALAAQPAAVQAAAQDVPQQPSLPEPIESPAPAIAYVKTAIIINGNIVGVLASHEAAEDLLRDITEHYTTGITDKGEREITFGGEVTLAQAQEGAQAMPADELFAQLTARNTPIEVVCTVRTNSSEPIAYKSIKRNDKTLVVGTKIVESLGREGERIRVNERTYKNGVLKSDKAVDPVVLLEPTDAVVRVGAQKVTNTIPDKKQGEKGKDTDISFMPPCDAQIISNFGQRKGIMHLGLDYKTDEGTVVVACAAGSVVSVMERGGYGLIIELDHGNGFTTRYAHLSESMVKLGQQVAAGEGIAKAGSSGNAEGAHLHLELRIDSVAYNPRYYLG